jgi:hypothetical protein
VLDINQSPDKLTGAVRGSESPLVPGVNYLGGSRQLRRRVAPLSPPAIAGGGDTES